MMHPPGNHSVWVILPRIKIFVAKPKEVIKPSLLLSLLEPKTKKLLTDLKKLITFSMEWFYCEVLL